MKTKKNLSRDTVRLLRKVQKFLIEEPKRFNMIDGIGESESMKHMLAQPPCGTACCIAGAAYVVDTGMILNKSFVGFGLIEKYLFEWFPDLMKAAERLFYVKGPFVSVTPGVDSWPQFYADMYNQAKTPLERAISGVARIEHFIATDGQE